MCFLKKYPVALNELLLTPLLFHHALPCLADLPQPSGLAMQDLAMFGGSAAGAIRTAMSRLRSSHEVESFTSPDGVTRYRLSDMSRSISQAVQQRIQRPEGFLLAIFSFASSDSRERQVVRNTLRHYGFHKLAQNVYINGRINPQPLVAFFDQQGLSENVFLFPCIDSEEPAMRRRLLALFDVEGRKKVLTQFLIDLRRFLEAQPLSDDEFARRFLYAGPVHYRITYVEEPPFPASYLPVGYPLEELTAFLPWMAEERSQALRRYFNRVAQRR